eukprot:GHUV01004387.1.p3 GENE.GHUV01004387.1~~GHUV01004387.1.p3  ORF type:complete len:111 (-),score=19.29 GHUV01004387.1:695-1027(-)
MLLLLVRLLQHLGYQHKPVTPPAKLAPDQSVTCAAISPAPAVQYDATTQLHKPVHMIQHMAAAAASKLTAALDCRTQYEAAPGSSTYTATREKPTLKCTCRICNINSFTA